MKILTIEKAQELSDFYLNQIKEEDRRSFLFEHVSCVVEVCKLLALGKNIDLEALEIAALLHDIGQINVIEGHAEEGIRILEKDYLLNEIILDCILNHPSSSNPKTEEGKILQMADKLSIINLNILEIFLKSSNKNFNEEYNVMFKKMILQSAEMFERANKL